MVGSLRNRSWGLHQRAGRRCSWERGRREAEWTERGKQVGRRWSHQELRAQMALRSSLYSRWGSGAFGPLHGWVTEPSGRQLALAETTSGTGLFCEASLLAAVSMNFLVLEQGPGPYTIAPPPEMWVAPLLSSLSSPRSPVVKHRSLGFSSCPQSFQNQGLSQWVGSLHFLLWLSSNSLALIFLLVPFRQVLYTFILFSDLRSLFYCFDSLL